MSDHQHREGEECLVCRTPGGIEAVAIEMAKKVADGQFQVVVVPGPDVDDYAFAYTVGLAQRELPELIAIGRAHPHALYGIVQHMATYAIAHDGLKAGVYDNILEPHNGNTMHIEIADVDVAQTIEDYMGMGERIHRINNVTGWSVKQVLYPDHFGRTPTDPRYDQVRWPQLSLRITKH